MVRFVFFSLVCVFPISLLYEFKRNRGVKKNKQLNNCHMFLFVKEALLLSHLQSTTHFVTFFSGPRPSVRALAMSMHVIVQQSLNPSAVHLGRSQASLEEPCVAHCLSCCIISRLGPAS